MALQSTTLEGYQSRVGVRQSKKGKQPPKRGCGDSPGGRIGAASKSQKADLQNRAC